MRYCVAALVALVAAFVSSLVYVLRALPPGEGSFGIAKAVPFFITSGTMLFFGFIWFPATLITFITDRKRKWSVQGLLLLVSAVASLAAGHRVYTVRRAAAEYSRVTLISAEAATATNNFEKFAPIIDDYISKSPASIYPQVGYYRVIAALLGNASSPPELLQKLSEGLEDRHEFLGSIAQHPNCPVRAIARFRVMPNLDVYLAKNPQTSPELLESLSFSTNPTTRISVLQHPQTPQAVRERLTLDSDSLVRRFATNSMRSELIKPSQ